ncbi:phytanoyl-CoA dioxygenase family protein [Nocardiopsis ansamitocini]|uniref:Phytanoyl-CoA dioxygenase n=1 Tax=Nocardiopsis ansamitocini TaxID=1670832 RepID=A0A9W6P7V5_9ACTN|nr:phytanoyl-CoA dioxygenase family protein [Nocardiopsis ansamitocini]GLU48636.1 hypothetical protein Nans01_29870 [Nocardiopsis ansamitocini]
MWSDPGEVVAVDARREEFTRSGYLVLPEMVPRALIDRLVPEVDRWVDDGLRARSIACCTDTVQVSAPPVMELELPAHGALLTHPPLMDVLAQLIGSSFVFHHLHSDRHDAGRGGKPWHHDREPNASADPSLTMVHALHYLGGLDETVDSLVVLPGSHHESASKDSRTHLGTSELPDEIIIDRLPPGSTVLINSGLFHARRPAPPVSDRFRYFVDASYCQTGTQWRPAKPYWRHMLSRARSLGLDGGRWPELFAERHFTEYTQTA